MRNDTAIQKSQENLDLRVLLAGTDRAKLLKWPATDIDIEIRVLSDHDRQQSVFATERLFKTSHIEMNIGTGVEYDYEQSTQVLYRAISFPGKPERRVVATVEDFRKLMTYGIHKILDEEYVSFEKEQSPNLDRMTQEEFDILLQDLKKKPDSTLGKVTSLNIAKRLLHILVSQPEILPEDNG
jgi:hypothetical protein